MVVHMHSHSNRTFSFASLSEKGNFLTKKTKPKQNITPKYLNQRCKPQTLPLLKNLVITVLITVPNPKIWGLVVVQGILRDCFKAKTQVQNCQNSASYLKDLSRPLF